MKKFWNKGRRFPVVLAAVVILSLCLALPAAAQVTEVILDPTPVDVEPGDSFTVTLQINDIPPAGLAAYDFGITFTPGVIEFDTNVADHDWPDPDYGQPFAFIVDNVTGDISFNDIYASLPAPSGNITLVVLHGTVVSPGAATTDLHFDKADIKDPDGIDIPANVTDGEVIVTVPAPATVAPAGGTVHQPNKLAILLPWIAIAAGVILAGIITWLVLRRRRI